MAKVENCSNFAGPGTMAPVNNNSSNGSLCSFKKDRGMNWSEAETMSLLEVWSDNLIQSELGNSTRNQHVYQVISQALGTRGIDRSATQCRVRIKNLKKEYKDVLDNKHDRRRSFRFFEKMHQIINGFQALAGAGLHGGELGGGFQIRCLSGSSASAMGDTNGASNRSIQFGGLLKDESSVIMSPSVGGQEQDDELDQDRFSDDVEGELQDGDLSDEGSSMMNQVNGVPQQQQQGMPGDHMRTGSGIPISSLQSTSTANDFAVNGGQSPLSFAATLTKTFGANFDLISLAQAQARVQAQSHAATTATGVNGSSQKLPSNNNLGPFSRVKTELSPESSWTPVSSHLYNANGETLSEGTNRHPNSVDNRVSNGSSAVFNDSQLLDVTPNASSSEPKSKRLRLNSSSSTPQVLANDEQSLFSRFFAFQRDIEGMRLEHEALMEERRRRWEDERRREERNHEMRLLRLMAAVRDNKNDREIIENHVGPSASSTSTRNIQLQNLGSQPKLHCLNRSKSLPDSVNLE